MIITPEQLPKLERAGRIASEALQYAKSLIKPGASLLEATDKTEERILSQVSSLGGGLAFPVQISLNEAAAHNCPDSEDKTIFSEEDIIKIDIGVHIDGLIADTALTVYLGNDNEKKRLVEASKKAFEEALKAIKPGVAICEIGSAIEKAINSVGFKPVRNLSGHGLGLYSIHEPPTIPNFNNGGRETLEESQLIAIEPFASTGAGMIQETGNAEVFMLVNKKPTRSSITKDVLKEVEKLNGLPFTTRWLTRKFSVPRVKYALNEMQRMEMIMCYPPLVDRAKGLISQHEHTVVVREKPLVITRQ